MTRQKLKALLSRFSSYPVFNISSAWWISAPEGILYTHYLFMYRCPAFLLFQDRLVWYCHGIWSREEDQPTQCLVSHCQCWCPPGSHPQNQVLSTGQLIAVIVMIFTKGATIYGCSLVSPQVGACQPKLSVSNPPDGPAVTQRYLLCHCWTPARLHGHPQTYRHPIYKSPERRVSFLFCFTSFLLWCAHSIVFHHSSRKVSSDNFIGNPMRTWASSLCVYLLSRELELQRKSSATDIAKKKQEAESAVSTGTRKQAVIRCVCGIIDHCLWVLLSSLCWENFLLFALLHPSSILFLFLLPWLLCRFCWCRNLWGES